jgi:PAS domain S-box-containing protein
MHSVATTLAKRPRDMRFTAPRSAAMNALFRYGIALSGVAIAIAISYPLRGQIYTTPLFFVTVVLTCWYGGTKPAIVVTLASAAVIHFFIHLPRPPITTTVNDFPRLAEFIFISAVAIYLVGARKRAEQSLRQARDELEIKVEERTAELTKLNDELLNEITERALTDDQLRQTEQRLRDLIANAPVILFALDRLGVVTLSEGKGLDTFGVRPGELVGQSIFDLYHDSPGLHSSARRALAGEAVTFVTDWNNQSFEIHLIPLFDKAGTVAGVTGVTYNITDRRKAERELRLVIDTIPAMSWSCLPDGANDYCSKGWMEFTGMKPGTEFGYGWADAFHPEDRAAHVAKWRTSIETGQLFESEARIRGVDGKYRWFLTQGVPFRDDSGRIVRWYGTNVDIDERKRAESLLAGEKRILEMVATSDTLSEILDSLCRLVEEQAEAVLASILLLENNRLRHGGGTSLPKAYTDAINGLAIGPHAGSCGTAAFTGKQVIVENIATDPLWTNYRDTALPHGLRACWSTPIFSSQGKVLATFAMYYREPRSPSPADEKIIEQITHLAGLAIERKLTQEKLKQSEAYLTEAQTITQTGSWAWRIGPGDASERAAYWSEENFRIWGLDPAQGLPDRETVFSRIHAEDRQRVIESASGVRGADYGVECRIVMPDGAIKHIETVGHLVRNDRGEPVELVGTHVDVTERKRAEALLAGEKRLLEMIATGAPLRDILKDLCLIIEEQRPGTLASALMLNPDGVHLDCVAGPNLPNDWKEQMEKLPIGPCAGSCGTAAYRAEPVIVSDIAADPLWNLPDHRASALGHGFRASWSNPVLSSKRQVLGTFCIYHREPRAPTPQDLELIELATHLVRVAIERDRAESALRSSEQLARSHVDVMMRSLDVLATEAAPEKFIGEMLRTIGQNLGAVRVLLWLRDPHDDSLRLHLAMEKDRQIPPDPKHPLINDPRGWRKIAFLQEMLFTKSPMVCDDIQNESRISPEFRDYLVSWGAKRFMTVPMFVTGELRGFIGIQHAEASAYRADQIELAQALAHHVMLAVRGQELVEQQRQAAILKERTRMARDIHDTLAQGFTGVVVQMEAAEEALFEEDPDNAVRHVRRARDLARDSLAEARRSVHALRPQALERAPFADALKAIIKNTAAGTSLRTDFRIKGMPRELGPAVEENLLHIGQEALTNALKHARASEFKARLCFDSNQVRLELQDNGDGFSVDKVNGGGFGLIGMKERAEHIGAQLEVSSAPGSGTKIVAVSRYRIPQPSTK